MKILVEREDEGVVVILLEGKLMIGDGDIKLREEVQRQLEKGEKQLLIDLHGLKAMDSSGLGELIRCKDAAEANGARIKLLHVEEKIEKVFEMTRLIGVFEHFRDRIDAVASFRTTDSQG